MLSHILNMEISLFGMTLVDIRRMVCKYCLANDINPFNAEAGVTGKDSAINFMKRHSDVLSIRKSQGISINRVKSTTETDFKMLFQNFEQLIIDNKLTGERIYNCDKTAVGNVYRPPKVVAQRGKKVAALISCERSKTTTLVLCQCSW